MVLLVVCVLLALASTTAPAHELEALPPPQPVPLHSTVDVGDLPAMVPRERLGVVPGEIRRRRPHDPAALRQWKDLLERAPETVPPAPGYVDDSRKPEPGDR